MAPVFSKTRIFVKTFKSCFIDARNKAKDCTYKNDEE